MTISFSSENVLEEYVSPTLKQQFRNSTGFDLKGIRYKVDPQFDFERERDNKVLHLDIDIHLSLGDKLDYKLRSTYLIGYPSLSNIEEKVDELIRDAFPRFQRGFDKLHPSLKFHRIAPILGSNFPKSMAALNHIISDKLKSQ